MLKTAKVAIVIQSTVQLPVFLLSHYLIEWRSIDNSPRIPGLGTMLAHLLGFIFVQEVSLYYIHRILHANRVLYQKVHRIHHYFREELMAFSTFYCHPVEHLFSSVIPVLLGPLLLGSHRCTIALWLVLVHIVTLNDHSGYDFPGFLSSHFHNYHHFKFSHNKLHWQDDLVFTKSN